MTQQLYSLGICPRAMKTYVHTNAYTQMTVAALFITAPNWTQSKRPSVVKTLLRLYYGRVLSNKRKQNINTRNNLGGSQGNYAEWKQPLSKGYILYDPIYITFLKLKKKNNL